ncbi:class I SAM-dependent methyltransferase [Opitutaceae bacterium]
MNFDRLAPYYNAMETLTAGSRLQRARVHGLDALAGCRRILSVGEGHGRFAEACLQRHPAAELTCLEASQAMAKLGMERTRHLRGTIRWEIADAFAWQTSDCFDAIVTCFFLDCFPEPTLARGIDHLARLAAPDAVWLVVDFAVPERALARLRARMVHGLMYAFFRCAVGLPARRLARHDRLLARNGFAREVRREFEWGLVCAEVWRRGR